MSRSHHRQNFIVTVLLEPSNHSPVWANLCGKPLNRAGKDGQSIRMAAVNGGVRHIPRRKIIHCEWPHENAPKENPTQLKSEYDSALSKYKSDKTNGIGAHGFRWQYQHDLKYVWICIEWVIYWSVNWRVDGGFLLWLAERGHLRFGEDINNRQIARYFVDETETSFRRED